MKARKVIKVRCEACWKPYELYEGQTAEHARCPSKPRGQKTNPRYVPVEEEK